MYVISSDLLYLTMEVLPGMIHMQSFLGILVFIK